MASVPLCPDHEAFLPVTGANTTSLDTRRLEPMRRQSTARASQEHQSVSYHEADGDGFPSQAVNQSPTSPNDVVDITPTFGSDVSQGAPTMLTQSAQTSNQFVHTTSASVVAASATEMHENPKRVLGKRRKSDASVSPNKRTKIDDPDAVPDVENNEILGSTTEPRPNLDDSTQHSDDTHQLPVNKEDSTSRVPEREQTASSGENATQDPQRQELEHARNPTDIRSISLERELRRPYSDAFLWPSDDEDVEAFEALHYIEDPERQANLVQHHRGRAIRLGKGLLQKGFDQVSVGRFNEADGWMKSVNSSREQGRREIGLIAEYPMPVLRADPRLPSPRSLFWVPGPDGLLIMCKICLGLIVINDYNVKLIKPFTTKSGTNPEHLRSSGDLKYYYQVIRSPQEDRVRIERDVVDAFEFESFNVPGVDWEIDGPRLMETMSMYQHPHAKPYRIVGQLKQNGYDEDLLVKLWRVNAEIGERETRRAFKSRREDPDWVSRFRTIAQSHIGDDTVVAESRVLPLADDASTVLDPRRPVEANTATRNYIQMNEGRGVTAADAQRDLELSALLL